MVSNKFQAGSRVYYVVEKDGAREAVGGIVVPLDKANEEHARLDPFFDKEEARVFAYFKSSYGKVFIGWMPEAQMFLADVKSLKDDASFKNFVKQYETQHGDPK